MEHSLGAFRWQLKQLSRGENEQTGIGVGDPGEGIKSSSG